MLILCLNWFGFWNFHNFTLLLRKVKLLVVLNLKTRQLHWDITYNLHHFLFRHTIFIILQFLTLKWNLLHDKGFNLINWLLKLLFFINFYEWVRAIIYQVIYKDKLIISKNIAMIIEWNDLFVIWNNVEFIF